jgi:hypothetical protein
VGVHVANTCFLWNGLNVSLKECAINIIFSLKGNGKWRRGAILLQRFLVQFAVLFLSSQVCAFPDGMSRQPLKYKLSQKLWSGLCFVAKAFALAPLSPNIHLAHSS